MPRSLQELEKLRKVSYSEVKALRNHLVDHSPFENKHGVKRAEFENVLVVVGRSWNQYNFDTMLTLAAKKIYRLQSRQPLNAISDFSTLPVQGPEHVSLYYLPRNFPRRQSTQLTIGLEQSQLELHHSKKKNKCIARPKASP